MARYHRRLCKSLWNVERSQVLFAGEWPHTIVSARISNSRVLSLSAEVYPGLRYSILLFIYVVRLLQDESARIPTYLLSIDWIDMTASAVVDIRNTYGAAFIGLFVSSLCV